MASPLVVRKGHVTSCGHRDMSGSITCHIQSQRAISVLSFAQQQTWQSCGGTPKRKQPGNLGPLRAESPYQKKSELMCTKNKLVLC